MTVIEEILQKSSHRIGEENPELLIHSPEMLLIGCVDARKDPTADLGIKRGRALILRNISALIRGSSVAPEQRETEAAALEFAVKVMQVKHIAVMGHTDCGGIRAALMETKLKDIRQYLSPLDELKNSLDLQSLSLEERARKMEIEAIKMSVSNLLSYDYIKEAVDAKKLTLHGWLLDIVTGSWPCTQRSNPLT